MFRVLFISVIAVCLNVLIMGSDGDAQPIITLVVDPDVRTMTVGGDVQELSIIVRTDKQNVQFAWKLDGPGELAGDTTNPGVLYLPPQTISGVSTQVTVTVTVTDDKGQSATGNVVFTLNAPQPTPTPTSTPTPTPPPTPTPVPSPTPTPTPIPTPTPTPTPMPTPTPGPIIGEISLKAKDNTIMNPIYFLSGGEIVTLAVEMTKPADHEVAVECKVIRGSVSGMIYTAPQTPGGKDMITVKALDKTTQKIIFQKTIQIQIR
jgi:hypothetical protein